MEGVTSSLIVEAVEGAAGLVHWRGDRADLADALEREAREGDVVLLMGAGDITRCGPELLARLASGVRRA